MNWNLFRQLAITGICASFALTPALAIEQQRDGITAAATLELSSDSNIERNAAEIHDNILTLTPEIGYRHNQGVFGFESAAGINIRRYDSYSDNDRENLFAHAQITGLNRQDSPLQGLFRISYQETTEANVDVANITTSRTFSTLLSGLYQVSEKLKLGIDPSYSNTEYSNADYADIRKATFGARIQYIYSPKLDLGLGARYAETSTKGGGINRAYDADDTSLFLIATGQLSPKVSGTVEVGAIRRSFDRQTDGFSNATRPYASIGLSWAAQERTTISLGISSDFAAAANNQSVRASSADIGLTHRLNEMLTGKIGVGYVRRAYSGGLINRKDENWRISGGLTATLNEWLQLGLNLSAEENDSDFALTDYTRYYAGISATVRY